MARHLLSHRHHDDAVADGTDRETGTTTTRAVRTDDEPTTERREHVVPVSPRETYGGTNWGACFFGWLVAVGVTVLLTAIAGAVAAAVGAQQNWTSTDADSHARSLALTGAIAAAVIMFVGYYAGGYVAGRMSRFDGARQGLGVWFIGLAVTVLAVVLGAIFGHQYNLLDRVDLPRIPVSTEQLGWGALVTAVAVVVGTALAAVVGGAAGRRYHVRVDHAVLR